MYSNSSNRQFLVEIFNAAESSHGRNVHDLGCIFWQSMLTSYFRLIVTYSLITARSFMVAFSVLYQTSQNTNFNPF